MTFLHAEPESSAQLILWFYMAGVSSSEWTGKLVSGGNYFESILRNFVRNLVWYVYIPPFSKYKEVRIEERTRKLYFTRVALSV